MTQRIYAVSQYTHRGEVDGLKAPRHDPVLVRGPRYAELNGRGLGAYDVARAHLFFVVRHRGRRLELCFGETYRKVCPSILVTGDSD